MSRKASIKLFVGVLCFIVSFFVSQAWFTSGLSPHTIYAGILLSAVVTVVIASVLATILEGNQ
jgi:hypothetical protein